MCRRLRTVLALVLHPLARSSCRLVQLAFVKRSWFSCFGIFGLSSDVSIHGLLDHGRDPTDIAARSVQHILPNGHELATG